MTIPAPSPSEIIQLSCLGDNYIHIMVKGNAAVIVDPGDAKPVTTFLKNRSLHCEAILLTHHHSDHIGGTISLSKSTGAPVFGPKDRRIRGVSHKVHDQEEFTVGGIRVRVLHVPGHSKSHLAYYCPDEKCVFTGDCLFSAGCGRLFEGTADQMWESLNKLASLPDETLMYCGHEYTSENLNFALSIEPDNAGLRDYLHEVEQKLADASTSLPSTIGKEKQINPFLRSDTDAIKQVLNMVGEPSVNVFAELRRRKDRF